jgi:hypothetical protein
MLATKINNNQWLYFVFALMKCSKAAFGEQKQNVILLGVRKPPCRLRGVKG